MDLALDDHHWMLPVSDLDLWSAQANECLGGELRRCMRRIDGPRAAMHPTYVGDTERGERNISLDGILRLSKALGVRPGDLLDGLEETVEFPDSRAR